jgi:hypothetical protein
MNEIVLGVAELAPTSIHTFTEIDGSAGKSERLSR